MNTNSEAGLSMPKERAKGLIVFLVTLVATVSVGCSDKGRQKTYQVEGTVTFSDGSPLRGGSVICLSESDANSLSARGNISDDGTFTLGTYEEADGAIAGVHLVAIDPPLPPEFNPDSGPAPRVIHPRYQQHDTSGLQFEVTENGDNKVQLEVSVK